MAGSNGFHQAASDNVREGAGHAAQPRAVRVLGIGQEDEAHSRSGRGLLAAADALSRSGLLNFDEHVEAQGTRMFEHYRITNMMNGGMWKTLFYIVSD